MSGGGVKMTENNSLDNDLLQYIKNDSNIPIVMVNLSGIILYCNKGFLKLIELEKISKGLYFRQFVEINYESQLDENDERGNIYSVEGQYKTDNNSITNLEGIKMIQEKHILYAFEKNMLYESDMVVEMSKLNMELTSLAREMSKKNRELQNANQKIIKMSNMDYLTQIFNRKYFFERFEERVALSKREQISNFGIISLDLDHFKVINDTYGHHIGDSVLIGVTSQIQTNLRREDIFSRIGGEEFIILIQCNSVIELGLFAEKIRGLVENVEFSEIKDGITISLGYTMYRYNESVQECINRSDSNMYRAKENGRNIACGDIEL